MYEHFSKKIFKKRDAQSFKLGCVAWLRCAHGASLTWASNTSCPCASSQTCTSPHVAVVLTQPRLCGLYNSSNYWLWIKNQNPFHGYVLDSPRQAAALIRSFVVASRVWKKNTGRKMLIPIRENCTTNSRWQHFSQTTSCDSNPG